MIKQQPIIEEILKQHRSDLNVDYDKYRNHVYRVFNFTMLLCEDAAKEEEALAIAAAYHDIGIWTAGTLDYIKPSTALAVAYMTSHKLLQHEELVTDIIANHHKVTRYKHHDCAEAFRKADMIDLSLGIITYGISGKEISEIYDAFPGEWFHTFILGEIIKNVIKNPLNPLPIMKW